MNHTILCVGEGKESYYKEAMREFQKRMQAFGSLEEVIVKPAKTPGRELSEDEIALALEKEAREFEKLLSLPKYQKSYKIALCIEGKSLSSEALSRLYEKVAGEGKPSVVYLVGSSWGMAERIKALCDLRLSFSPMTFAHSLFQVMLHEQIYRAESILHGSKYHK